MSIKGGREGPFFPKKHPKFAQKTDIFFGKGYFFVQTTNSPVVVRIWSPLRSERYILGLKSQLMARKSNFCHTITILVNGQFVALGGTVNFPKIRNPIF